MTGEEKSEIVPDAPAPTATKPAEDESPASRASNSNVDGDGSTVDKDVEDCDGKEKVKAGPGLSSSTQNDVTSLSADIRN